MKYKRVKYGNAEYDHGANQVALSHFKQKLCDLPEKSKKAKSSQIRFISALTKPFFDREKL